MPYKSRRCARKFTLRKRCLAIDPDKFTDDEKYKGVDVWDLDYISTSDEEDIDPNSDEESEEEEGEEKKQNEETKDLFFDLGSTKKRIVFEPAPGQDKSVPLIVRRLRRAQGAKKQETVVYQYRYSNEPGKEGEKKKYSIIKGRKERDLPENLIDFLLLKKQCNYQTEARVKLLRQNEQEDWDRLDRERDSSDDEVEDSTYNYVWYNGAEDQDNYFAMMTR